MTGARIVAVLLGFLGILVIARPGISPVGLGHLAGLGAALGFALTAIATKRISGRDGVATLLFWMTAHQAVFGLALALPGGIPWPSAALMPWVLAAGVSGLSAHLCLTFALRTTRATLVAPMEFVRLPVIALAGAAIYGEALDPWILAGAVLILAGNGVNLAGERQRPSEGASPRAAPVLTARQTKPDRGSEG